MTEKEFIEADEIITGVSRKHLTTDPPRTFTSDELFQYVRAHVNAAKMNMTKPITVGVTNKFLHITNVIGILKNMPKEEALQVMYNALDEPQNTDTYTKRNKQLLVTLVELKE